MVILSKACKPDNLESNNSLKLSFVNIRGRLSNCVDFESYLESNSPGILALCETNLDDSINSGNFSVKGYFSLIQKDSSTHMHGLAVYVKEGIYCTGFISRKLCRFLHISISNKLTNMVNFPSRIPDSDSYSLALLDLFLSSDTSICSTMAFPALGNSNHVVVSVPINFPLNSQWNAPFHHTAYDYSRADWDGLHDHLRDSP